MADDAPADPPPPPPPPLAPPQPAVEPEAGEVEETEVEMTMEAAEQRRSQLPQPQDVPPPEFPASSAPPMNTPPAEPERAAPHGTAEPVLAGTGSEDVPMQSVQEVPQQQEQQPQQTPPSPAVAPSLPAHSDTPAEPAPVALHATSSPAAHTEALPPPPQAVDSHLDKLHTSSSNTFDAEDRGALSPEAEAAASIAAAAAPPSARAQSPVPRSVSLALDGRDISDMTAAPMTAAPDAPAQSDPPVPIEHVMDKAVVVPEAVVAVPVSSAPAAADVEEGEEVDMTTGQAVVSAAPVPAPVPASATAPVPAPAPTAPTAPTAPAAAAPASAPAPTPQAVPMPMPMPMPTPTLAPTAIPLSTPVLPTSAGFAPVVGKLPSTPSVPTAWTAPTVAMQQPHVIPQALRPSPHTFGLPTTFPYSQYGVTVLPNTGVQSGPVPIPLAMSMANAIHLSNFGQAGLQFAPSSLPSVTQLVPPLRGLSVASVNASVAEEPKRMGRPKTDKIERPTTSVPTTPSSAAAAAAAAASKQPLPATATAAAAALAAAAAAKAGAKTPTPRGSKATKTPKAPATAAGATAAAAKPKTPRATNATTQPTAAPETQPPAAEEAEEEEEADYVACDRCEKWRKVPPGINSKNFPEKWFCEMNTWDPTLASCDAPERTDEPDTQTTETGPAPLSVAAPPSPKSSAPAVGSAEKAPKAAALPPPPSPRVAAASLVAKPAPAVTVTESVAAPATVTSTASAAPSSGVSLADLADLAAAASAAADPGSGEGDGSLKIDIGLANGDSKNANKSRSRPARAATLGPNGVPICYKEAALAAAVVPPPAPMGSPTADSLASPMPKKRGPPAADTSGKKPKRRRGQSLTESQKKWVQCDKCQKWRSVPAEVNVAELPEQWFCTMNSWDAATATCDAPAEPYDDGNDDDVAMGDGVSVAAPSMPSTPMAGLGSVPTVSFMSMAPPPTVTQLPGLATPAVAAAVTAPTATLPLPATPVAAAPGAAAAGTSAASTTKSKPAASGQKQARRPAKAAAEGDDVPQGPPPPETSKKRQRSDNSTAGAGAVGRKPMTASSIVPVANQEGWVQCDNAQCRKWRRVPVTVDLNTLPAKWFCNMNTWNPSEASCDAPVKEEEPGTGGGWLAAGISPSTFRGLIFTWNHRMRTTSNGSNRSVAARESVQRFGDSSLFVKSGTGDSARRGERRRSRIRGTPGYTAPVPGTSKPSDWSLQSVTEAEIAEARNRQILLALLSDTPHTVLELARALAFSAAEGTSAMDSGSGHSSQMVKPRVTAMRLELLERLGLVERVQPEDATMPVLYKRTSSRAVEPVTRLPVKVVKPWKMLAAQRGPDT